MSRPVCGHAIRGGGTCAELQGHKSMCRTAEQKAAYEKQMAELDRPKRRR